MVVLHDGNSLSAVPVGRSACLLPLVVPRRMRSRSFEPVPKDRVVFAAYPRNYERISIALHQNFDECCDDERWMFASAAAVKPEKILVSRKSSRVYAVIYFGPLTYGRRKLRERVDSILRLEWGVNFVVETLW